jgi:hypothetical protein
VLRGERNFVALEKKERKKEEEKRREGKKEEEKRRKKRTSAFVCLELQLKVILYKYNLIV